MKKCLILFFLFFIFSFFFQNRVGLNAFPSSLSDNNSKNGVLDEKDLTIMFVNNASIIGAVLGGVTVKRVRASNPDLDTIYDGDSITFPVQNGDVIIFSKTGRETVSIKINEVLKLKKIGIFMFVPMASQSNESIEGTAMKHNNSTIPFLPMSVGSVQTATDSAGIYIKSQPSSTSFNIKFISKKIVGQKIAEITANTVNNGGRTVIDVAFDEDATKNDF